MSRGRKATQLIARIKHKITGIRKTEPGTNTYEKMVLCT